MNEPVTDTYQPGLFADLLYFAYDLSAAWIAIVVLASIAVGLWLAYKALPFLRVVQALKTAPQVAVGSGKEGAAAQDLVKVVGRAYPGSEIPEGYAAPDHVWRTTSTLDTGSVVHPHGTGTYSVAPVLVRDETAECLVNVLEAQVLHADKSGTVDRHFGGDATYETERSIRTGDPVLAIGVLGKAKKRPGHGELPRCTLRRSKSGVLVLSGQSESRTLLRFRLRFWPRAALASGCVVFALWLAQEHLASYPEPAMARYLDMLMTDPWTPAPGVSLYPNE
jgi:hypothetical protein